MERTNPTWPTTWFVPRLTGSGAFKDVYSVMNNWGANHGAISYGHIGADLITLASMLRIPVYMHNVPEENIFRPSAWDSFGTRDPEGADFRACANYGPLYGRQIRETSMPRVSTSLPWTGRRERPRHGRELSTGPGSLSEAHRFESGPVRLPDGLHTDVLRIWSELKHGMLQAVKMRAALLRGSASTRGELISRSLTKKGCSVSNPYQYRDSLTDGILPKAFKRVPEK